VQPLRYGIVGGGFQTTFQLRALEQVRGVEVAGLVSRRPPEKLAAYVRERGLGNGRIIPSVREMAANVDVIAIFAPNYTRLPVVGEIAEALQAGAELKAVICDKPLARNLPEARQMLDLMRPFNVPLIYFENQVHMKTVAAHRAQLRPVIEAMGPMVLVRSSEEHAGPHTAWFWDPTQQGGGVMSDMGCHCLAVGWYVLTPPGKPVRFLKPTSVMADLSLLKWGQPSYRRQLIDRFGIDYAKIPAEDFATGMGTYEIPESVQKVKGHLTVSWKYDELVRRLLRDERGPG